MTKANIKFLRREVQELLQVIQTKEDELQRTLTMEETNDLLIPFIQEHDKELVDHVLETLTIEEREELIG